MDKLRGIIFRILEAKEADRVVYLLTDQGEKVVVIAKGVKKTQSRKAHAVDLLNFVEFKLYEGKGMPIITEAKLLESFDKFKHEYSGLMFAQFVCELIGLFAEEGQEDVGIFNNVYQSLLSGRAEKYGLIAAALILRIMYNSGDLPKLNEDVDSGLEISWDAARLRAPHVGYIAGEKNSKNTISDRLYKVQRFIIKQDFRRVQDIELSESEQIELLELHIGWLQNVVEKKLKTAELFLTSLG